MMHPDGSAKETGLGDITKGIWNMRFIVVFTEPFFTITQEACLCGKVLKKHLLGRATLNS